MTKTDMIIFLPFLVMALSIMNPWCLQLNVKGDAKTVEVTGPTLDYGLFKEL